MTWQTGEGPEPAVKVILPAELRFMPPWGWKYLGWCPEAWWQGAPGSALALREEAEAADEMREALEAAVAHLPELYSPDNPNDPSRRMGRKP